MAGNIDAGARFLADLETPPSIGAIHSLLARFAKRIVAEGVQCGLCPAPAAFIWHKRLRNDLRRARNRRIEAVGAVADFAFSPLQCSNPEAPRKWRLDSDIEDRHSLMLPPFNRATPNGMG